ncbi:protein MMS22-like [Anoplophora glabripennis]|uniref:protein MMS22-like n=1 Tax=Anoplophora glabripennis TaxID=217634 RepID=UPI0008745539|nr:protein MMS22-like [Anoplophora glabripennis]
MSYIFNCDKNKSGNDFAHFRKIFTPKYKEPEDVSVIYIGKHIYHRHVIIEEIDVVIRIVQTEWYQLQSVILYENILSFSELIYSREVLNGTFLAISESLQLCNCSQQKSRYIESVKKALDNFTGCVVPITKFPDEMLAKISTSATNDAKCPIYQYFHSFLDVQYHLLVLYYVCGAPEDKLENRITSVMKDIITVIKKNYRRQSIQNRQPFLCSCIKESWLVLQVFTEKIGSDKNWFWKIFNSVLENEDSIFTLWLLKYISSLQLDNTVCLDEDKRNDRVVPNYSLLESKLKIILSSAGSDTFLECFRIIEPLLCDLWLTKGRIEVFQIIWDHYSKRLNISKKKPTQKALQLNEIIDSLLSSPKECNDDFEIFVGMLILHLRAHPTHWGKIKGRIYSQLGPNKVKDLNETGVTHVMVIFLSLASVNFNELSKKIISVLENLPMEKRNTHHVWNIYAIFMIRHVLEGRDLEGAAPFMLQLLRDAVNDQKTLRLVRDFIENFGHIINHSTNYQLHQWLLIDTWLPNYMAICYHSDLKAALDVLLCTLDKVSNPDSWSSWEPAFRDYVYPSMRQISTPSAPDTVGKIAGKLCLLMPNITNEAFNFFNSETIPPRISCQFLDKVLADFPNSFILTPSQELVVLQSWMKICLLTTDLYENLTLNVLKLDCFPATLKTHIGTSQDPVYAFIEYLGSDIKQHLHSNSMIKLCETCFGQIDKWLGQYLTQPDDETLVFRVYTCISLAFLHCGPLLYDRNKSTSPLTKLVQVLLLPTDFLIGKRVPHNFVLNAVKKTWHIFFEAIVKLNSDIDTFLERTLRDMVLKYMQYFSTADSPIIRCLENTSTAPILLDKISNSYFRHPVKESDANTLKVLKILSDFVQSTTSLPLMRLIINKCLYGLFEIVIFHAQRNVALSLIKVLTCSPLYPQVREDFGKSIITVTEKHLAFNTINYFQLMYVLAKFIPADVKNLLGNIKQNVSNVERMRGVGFDKNLRTHFEKLEAAVEIPK